MHWGLVKAIMRRRAWRNGSARNTWNTKPRYLGGYRGCKPGVRKAKIKIGEENEQDNCILGPSKIHFHSV